MAKDLKKVMDPTESKDLPKATESTDGGSVSEDEAIDAAVAEPEVEAPASRASQTDDASPASNDSGGASEEGGKPSIEELVERKVAERISTIFPQGLEAPRIASPREELDASDYLRLGYGTRSPHV